MRLWLSLCAVLILCSCDKPSAPATTAAAPVSGSYIPGGNRTLDNCRSISELAGEVARARDRGIPLNRVLGVIGARQYAGQTLDARLAALIYQHPNVSAREYEAVVFQQCMQTRA